MQILEAALYLRDKGLGEKSPHTIINYFRIYAIYQIYEQKEKVNDAIFLTADAACCSEGTVKRVKRFMKLLKSSK